MKAKAMDLPANGNESRLWAHGEMQCFSVAVAQRKAQLQHGLPGGDRQVRRLPGRHSYLRSVSSAHGASFLSPLHHSNVSV